MKKFTTLFLIFCMLPVLTMAQNTKQKLIYSDDFNNGISNWTAEFEIPETSGLKLIDSKLDLVSSRGATVWFNHKLSGGANDRVSDMNAFWMATDPSNADKMIKRDGKFSSYDNLSLYYAGIGGHYNKFTRFRKYNSNGEKPVLKEYADAAHLLVGNKKYSIKIIVNNGLIQYYLNDELYWELKDETPYKEGYFGFRTTISHQQFENFKVFQL